MKTIQDELNELGSEILDASIVVHKALGPGLLESCYRMALAYELRLRGIKALENVKISFEYKVQHLGNGFEIDILVQDMIIVEIKSVAELHPVATAQLITYLKLSSLSLGYLINFNVPMLKEGFKRIVYGF